ncbi:MAG: transport protein RbsD/FucU [Dermatophilaceae bacterium]|nr:transport protein RbsD/FucU [Dermatophilaceae bacterium]NUO92145.1 transport protein RbsD/FucU [Dermatophilaceae bacterium]
MLSGVHPLLTGGVLLHLDAMGHSDAVAVVDAHFPAARLGRVVVEVPGATAPQMLAAVRSVTPPDDVPALDLMEAPGGDPLEVQDELMAAARVDAAETRFLDRFAYYELVAGAQLVIRTGEARAYGNAILRKGLVSGEDSP